MTETVSPNVLSEVRDGILYVTVNRPASRNALSRAALDELRLAFQAAADNASLHLAVLTGAGDKSFAAGGDLREFASLRSEADAEELFNRAATALDAIRGFPLPVIAALNGTALGGGAELAMACDYRVAASHACIGFVQSTLAITTGFGGGADLFRHVGAAQAMRMLVQGEVLSATAAVAAGLVDDIAGPDESLGSALARFARPFLARPAHVVRAVRQIALSHRLAPAACREVERRAFATTWAHPAHWDAADKVLAPRR